MATVGSVMEKHISTSSINRLTSNEEFNSDADYAIQLKDLYLKMSDRHVKEGPGKAGRRTKFNQAVFEYVRDEFQRIKKKTWGEWHEVKLQPPPAGDVVWVRSFGLKLAKPKKCTWDGKRFTDVDGKEVRAGMWSPQFEKIIDLNISKLGWTVKK